MECYLRFTESFHSEDFSYLKTPSMKKAMKLKGLCAFRFGTIEEVRDMSRDEILKKVDQFRDAYYIYDKGTVCIFQGEYLGSNPNGEGSIVKKGELLHVFYTD